MSPEHARGQVLDARSDLFSFGAVLYEMIAGVSPFAGETVASVFDALLNLNPLPLSRVNSQVPSGLEDIVFKALQKDRDLRYRRAAEIRADLLHLKRELELGTTGVSKNVATPATRQSAGISTALHALTESRTARAELAASVLHKARSPRFLIPLLLALLLAAAVKSYKLLDNNRRGVPASTASIAVLPFADLSPRGDQVYFSDGLSEELLDHLARVPGLKVAARSSAFQFKGKNVDVREVAFKLGVANVLEGSVRRESNHVRITATLIKAQDGFQLWSQTYDREINGILAVQDEIASAATEALQLKLLADNGQPIASSRSVNPEAYTAYLEAKFFNRRGPSKEDLGKALAYADRAITLDDKYAPAWALRSSVHNMMAQASEFDPTAASRKARVDAERAIALDPSLASAYVALATTQVFSDWDWEAAEASLNKAETLEPSNADVFRIRSYLSRVLGNLNQAINLYEQAVALDPLRAASHVSEGYLLYVAGRYDESRAALQKSLELNAQSAYVHAHLARILIFEGKPQQALAEIQEEPIEWQRLEGQVLAYYALGREQESDGVLAALIAKHQNDAAYQIAEVYAFRGESDKSFAWLERAYQQRDTGLPEIKTDPLLHNLRPDRRFNELLKKLQLPT